MSDGERKKTKPCLVFTMSMNFPESPECIFIFFHPHYLTSLILHFVTVINLNSTVYDLKFNSVDSNLFYSSKVAGPPRPFIVSRLPSKAITHNVLMPPALQPVKSFRYGLQFCFDCTVGDSCTGSIGELFPGLLSLMEYLSHVKHPWDKQ